MSDVTDVALVRDILEKWDDGEYRIGELHYEYNKGDKLDLAGVEDVPAGWVFTVQEVDDSKDYDSHGNSYTDSAYVILSVTDSAGNTASYKLPGEYASYEGWSWKLEDVKVVTRQQRLITTWDWV